MLVFVLAGACLALHALPAAMALSAQPPQPLPVIELPPTGITPAQLAVVYLQGDALSEKIARYYAHERGIPEQNIAAIDLPHEQGVVEPGLFAVQKKLLDSRLPGHIQAYALAWASPYRVGCMGMTAAFAFGFDAAYCTRGCNTTKVSRYYSSASIQPFGDYGVRPAMLLAATSFEDAGSLVQRGIAADGTLPEGSAYLLETSSRARSVRKIFFPAVQKDFGRYHRVKVMKQDKVLLAHDIMFYFTGRAHVEGLDTLRFLPGAMADHLTSFGGILPESGHMSAIEWLRAGATGSYGTAVEPCAFVQKFPNPHLAMRHYRAGESLLEAYWKSVAMPGQGNFIGEPLAAPFRGYRLHREADTLVVQSPVFTPGRYRVLAGAEAAASEVLVLQLGKGEQAIVLPTPLRARYRIERIGN